MPVEFLSMAPDYTKDMNKVLKNEISSSKVFGILLNITEQIDKLSRDEGHETRAYSYGNFELYIKNMVARWLIELISMDDMLNDFGV